MPRTRIGFDPGEVIGNLRGMFPAVRTSAEQAWLFADPRHYPNSALGLQMKLLDEVGGCHGKSDTGTVVEGAGVEIPGIEMTGDDDDLSHRSQGERLARCTGQNQKPGARKGQCADTITHPAPRTLNGSSILTRPSVGRS